MHVHLVFVKLSFLKTTFCSPLTPPLYQLRPELHAKVMSDNLKSSLMSYLASIPKFAHCALPPLRIDSYYYLTPSPNQTTSNDTSVSLVLRCDKSGLYWKLWSYPQSLIQRFLHFKKRK